MVVIKHQTKLVPMATIDTFINACSFINDGKVKEKHRLTITFKRADVILLYSLKILVRGGG